MQGVTCFRPQGAFYAFPHVASHYGKRAGSATIKNSDDLATYLIEEARIAVVAGAGFGADEHVRLSYATSLDKIRVGLDRMSVALSKLQ